MALWVLKGIWCFRKVDITATLSGQTLQTSRWSWPGPDCSPAYQLRSAEGPCVRGAAQYLEAWLGGLGCVPLYNLMEDAATAEICRTQARMPSAHPCPLS